MTLSTRQSFSGWLNDEACSNIDCIFVTLSTRQSFSGWSNDEAPQNIQLHPIRDIVDAPVAQRLVERRGARNIPLIFVTLSPRQSLERRVERRGVEKHPSHLRDARCIPRAPMSSLKFAWSMKSSLISVTWLVFHYRDVRQASGLAPVDHRSVVQRRWLQRGSGWLSSLWRFFAPAPRPDTLASLAGAAAGGTPLATPKPGHYRRRRGLRLLREALATRQSGSATAGRTPTALWASAAPCIERLGRPMTSPALAVSVGSPQATPGVTDPRLSHASPLRRSAVPVCDARRALAVSELSGFADASGL